MVDAAEKHKVGGFSEFFWCDLEVLVEPSEGLAADQLVPFECAAEAAIRSIGIWFSSTCLKFFVSGILEMA